MKKTTRRAEPFNPEVLNELLAGLSSPEDLLGEAGLFKSLKKALMERVLGAELTHHLGYETGDQRVREPTLAATAKTTSTPSPNA